MNQDIIENLHNKHQGIVKYFDGSITSVLWPVIIPQIEKKVSTYEICYKEVKKLRILMIPAECS